jgi:hypothetical protein
MYAATLPSYTEVATITILIFEGDRRKGNNE